MLKLKAVDVPYRSISNYVSYAWSAIKSSMKMQSLHNNIWNGFLILIFYKLMGSHFLLVHCFIETI